MEKAKRENRGQQRGKIYIPAKNRVVLQRVTCPVNVQKENRGGVAESDQTR